METEDANIPNTMVLVYLDYMLVNGTFKWAQRPWCKQHPHFIDDIKGPVWYRDIVTNIVMVRECYTSNHYIIVGKLCDEQLYGVEQGKYDIGPLGSLDEEDYMLILRDGWFGGGRIMPFSTSTGHLTTTCDSPLTDDNKLDKDDNLLTDGNKLDEDDDLLTDDTPVKHDNKLDADISTQRFLSWISSMQEKPQQPSLSATRKIRPFTYIIKEGELVQRQPLDSQSIMLYRDTTTNVILRSIDNVEKKYQDYVAIGKLSASQIKRADSGGGPLGVLSSVDEGDVDWILSNGWYLEGEPLDR